MSEPESTNPLLRLRPCYQEALSLFEILRTVGFDSDQIYFYPSDGIISLTVLVHDQHYPIRAADWPDDVAIGQLLAGWAQAGLLWNEIADESHRKEMLEGTDVRARFVLILSQLQEANILPGAGDC